MTAAYATKEDLLRRDEAYLRTCAYSAMDDTWDDDGIDQALIDATDEINTYLSVRYTLPLESIPNILTSLTIPVTFYWLGDSNSQVTKLVEERYKNAIARLKDISSGKADLGLPEKEKPNENALGEVTWHSEKRKLTRSKLGTCL
ncbi:gp436 family protein [Vibrio paucivorans]